MIHVPYRGSGPALTDLIGGQVQILYDGIPTSIEHIRAGELRALAVTTVTRSEALPDTPTVDKFVPGYEARFWVGRPTRANDSGPPKPPSTARTWPQPVLRGAPKAAPFVT